MHRLTKITYVFPRSTDEERTWNHFFGKLLMDVHAVNKSKMMISSFSDNALPTTEFQTGNTRHPMIIFNTREMIDVKVARLAICDNHTKDFELSGMIFDENNVGNHSAVEANSISNFYQLLKGRLTGVDHTGVNVPVSQLHRLEWEELIHKISKICNLYRYPDEDWPFIIPADESEFATDITQFLVKRSAKFEFVYDSYCEKPIFQFALETDISKLEMESIFPSPIGFAIPGLENFFRSVFVLSPWDDDFAFRFDLYYKSVGTELTDWETGEWLIKNGGRIKP